MPYTRITSRDIWNAIFDTTTSTISISPNQSPHTKWLTIQQVLNITTNTTDNTLRVS